MTMGILDGLINTVASQLEGTALPGLLQKAMEQTNLGSLQGLVDKLRETGLGAQVDSWLGTGANEPITADQLKNAVGHTVEQAAAALNLPTDQIFDFLSKHLPGVIDKLSPNGTLQDPPA
jgi:uncharacterized protein YidB (DUF937 family)